jgi:ribosomal protein S18 acetylase RimI-like enzyme
MTDSKRPFIIRPLELDDLAAVFHLGEKLFTSRLTPNAYRIWDEYEVVDFFQGSSEFCFVAEMDAEVVGFLLGTTIEKSHSSWRYGYLTWIGVVAGVKKTGIGRSLVRKFIAACEKEGVRILLIDTEAENEDAIRFFTSLGFGNPENHIYMSLNLSTAGRGSRTREKAARKEKLV